MWYYFDSQWVETPCIDAQDRAFQYGDGVFETIIVCQGKALFAADHYERLQAGAGALGLTLPGFMPQYSQEFALWLQSIVETWGRLSGQDLSAHLRLKLMLWRSPGGLYAATHSDARCLIKIQPQTQLYEGEAVRTVIYDAYRLHAHPLAAVKRLQALPYILAARYARQSGVDDALLLDFEGHIAEATSSNVFWVSDGVFYTPSLDTGCVAGIMRRQWLRYFQEHGIACRQGRFLPETLAGRVEGCWLVNVAGVRRVQEINGIALHCPIEFQDFVKQMQAAVRRAAIETP